MAGGSSFVLQARLYIGCFMTTASPIVASGLLIRDSGGFALRRDGGGQLRLDLVRAPVDHVEKRVRVTGVLVGDALIEVDSILPIDR